jgi:hypothetical protein
LVIGVKMYQRRPNMAKKNVVILTVNEARQLDKVIRSKGGSGSNPGSCGSRTLDLNDPVNRIVYNDYRDAEAAAHQE